MLEVLMPLSAVLLILMCVVFIIYATTRMNLHPFLALLFAALGFGLLYGGMSLTEIVNSINQGFGRVIGGIGIVIIAGTIIGTFLEKSGGAFAIAERTLKVVGEKQVPGAMSIIGYIVSIPVFADSGFVILAPLNKALSKRAGITLAASAMALALGLAISHSLIPPTPGPIAAAGILKANLGLVIMAGVPISLVSLVVAWLFAVRIASRIHIDPEPDLSEEEIAEKMVEAPSAFKSIVPVLTPIFLIVLKSIADYPTEPFGTGILRSFFSFIGQPVIALLIGVALAFTLPKKFERSMWSTNGWVGQGLVGAALIVMVTGAGGAFGQVIKNSGIANVLGDMLKSANLGIWLPFIIAAAIKTAQGSSTVSLITTASILSPMLPELGFETAIAKALCVLAIGAGAMVVSHANDSFFWVLTQMSRMDVKTGYKLQTVGTLIVGTSTAVVIWIVSQFVPMTAATGVM